MTHQSVTRLHLLYILNLTNALLRMDIIHKNQVYKYLNCSSCLLMSRNLIYCHNTVKFEATPTGVTPRTYSSTSCSGPEILQTTIQKNIITCKQGSSMQGWSSLFFVKSDTTSDIDYLDYPNAVTMPFYK